MTFKSSGYYLLSFNDYSDEWELSIKINQWCSRHWERSRESKCIWEGFSVLVWMKGQQKSVCVRKISLIPMGIDDSALQEWFKKAGRWDSSLFYVYFQDKKDPIQQGRPRVRALAAFPLFLPLPLTLVTLFPSHRLLLLPLLVFAFGALISFWMHL